MREEVLTASATSPTPFSAISSLSSPPRKAPAPESSRPGGAISGARPLSTSTAVASSSMGMNSLVSWCPITHHFLPPWPRPTLLHPQRTEQLRAATLDAWLQSPAVDNLQELYLCYPTGYRLPLPLLSESIFRLSTTLCVATIERCHIPDAVEGLQFPQLKQLTLGDVRISECSLHHMIAGCPALECLLIEESFGFRCFRVNAVSLRSIGVRAAYYHKAELKLRQLTIENAPCLERLLHYDWSGYLHVSVIFAPKLETLRCSSNPSIKILFGSTVIQGLRIDSIRTVVHSIKILAVDMDILSLDTIIELMRCFPCLEKLYIKAFRSGPNNLWLRKHQNLIKCHDIRLKKIVFEIYSGIKSQISFLTFFILNVRGLELMILRIGAMNYNGEFLAEHRSKLKLENRASRGALIQFTTDRSLRDIWHITHICDLDLTDPFSC